MRRPPVAVVAVVSAFAAVTALAFFSLAIVRAVI